MALLSMTGFGEARAECDGYSIAVEVRTVNSRYFKLHLRTTDGFGALESHIDKVIREFVKRGTIHCNVRIHHEGTADDYRLNTGVLNQYIDQLQHIAAGRDLDEVLRLEPLASLPGVVEELGKETLDSSELWPMVEPVVRTALDHLGQMRATEGEALATDLQDQCRVVASALDAIEEQAPKVGDYYRQRITDRVNEALGNLNMSVEPADLVREICLFTDRSDISEETVRLRSHLSQFHDAMKLAESAGRKLEFICQEMSREVNTIGSKANDADISLKVVEIKTALERIREQIQNVQ